MRAIRLVIHQSSANYKKEETIENKMTYPLPPISTVIGAIHAACAYREYHPMDISIQGTYESMHREPYTDYCFLNSVQDDRGTLVKMRNGTMLSNAFERVAVAKKPQGNSFRNGVTIQVLNQMLLDEYCQLKDLNDEIGTFKKERLAPVLERLKVRKKQLAAKRKQIDKSDKRYIQVTNRETELKEMENLMKFRMEEFQKEHYSKPISRYRSLTTSLKFYEILNNVRLIIHIHSDERTLEDIMEHIYSLKAIGRSEDMVTVEKAEIVELLEEAEDEVVSQNSAYVCYDMIEKERIMCANLRAGRIRNGTKYYMNKNYNIVDGKRIFQKKKVLYLSQYVVEEFGDGLYLDRDGEEEYIVNFL